MWKKLRTPSIWSSSYSKNNHSINLLLLLWMTLVSFLIRKKKIIMSFKKGWAVHLKTGWIPFPIFVPNLKKKMRKKKKEVKILAKIRIQMLIRIQICLHKLKKSLKNSAKLSSPYYLDTFKLSNLIISLKVSLIF